MPRLPVPGSDNDDWGTLLNTFLQVAHREDGNLRSTYEVINVRDFGALGDGSAVDSAAIQSALNDAGSRGGGIVYVPQGTYILSSALLLPSSVELRGAGAGVTILRLADQAGTDMLRNVDRVNGNSHVTVRDLELDGNKANNPRKPDNPGAERLAGIWEQAGIHWIKVARCRIVDCLIHDCAWNGIVISGAKDTDIVNCTSDNNGNVVVGPGAWGQFEAFGFLLWEAEGGSNQRTRVLNCRASGNEKHGIEILGATHADNLIFGCYASSNNGDGITINALGSQHAADIIASTCLDNAGDGVHAIGDAILIDGNYVARNNHGEFKNLIGTTMHVSGASINVQGDNCTIVNNRVTDALSRVSGNFVEGVVLTGSNGRIANNSVKRVQGRGVLFNGRNNIILGNTIADAGIGGASTGIGIQGNDAMSAIVEGNSVRGSSSDGIYMAGVGGGHRIAGNQVEGNSGQGISLVSQDDCLVEGNRCLSNGAQNQGRDFFGILLTACLRTIITANRCGNNASPQTQRIGISMSGACDYALISGNILVGNTSRSLVVLGANTIAQANLVDP